MTSRQISDLKKALGIVGDKWSLTILMQLHEHGPRRFGDCQKADGINTKTLTQRLQALEQAGLIERHEYREYPPRTEYSITGKGAALVPVFERLAEWGKTYL